MINRLYSELYGTVVGGNIDTLLLKCAIQSIIRYDDKRFADQIKRYGSQWQKGHLNDIKYGLARSMLKNMRGTTKKPTDFSAGFYSVLI